MADETKAGTPATGTSGSIEEAAARIAARRAKGAAPAQNAPPDNDTGQDTSAEDDDLSTLFVGGNESDDDNSTQAGNEGPDDTDDDGADGVVGDEDGAEGDESGIGDEPGQSRSVFDALPKKLLGLTVNLPIDGKMVPMKLEDAIRGTMRQADYTQKTMKLSEKERLYDERTAQYERVLPVLIAQIEESGPPKRTDEQWQELYETDPLRFMKERADEQAKQLKLDKIRAEQQRLHDERLAQYNGKMQERVALSAQEFNGFLAKTLKLADTAAQNKHKAELLTYLRSDADLKVTDNELVSLLVDPRYFKIASKAMLFDKAMSARQALREKQKAPARVGALPAGRTQATVTSAEIREKKALSALKKTGTVDDAVAALAARRQKNRGRR